MAYLNAEREIKMNENLRLLLEKMEQTQILCEVLFYRNNRKNAYIVDDFVCQSRTLFNNITELLNTTEELVYHIIVRTLDYKNNYNEVVYEITERNDFSNYCTYNYTKIQ